jgi:3-oxoacyl-[acyl-carrier protein] reductase
MDLGIKGQRALVTGGTKGIGRAIAETLAAEGVGVSICARNEAEVESAVEALGRSGAKAFGRAFDVGNGEALAGWVKESAEVLGGIDIVVSNVSGANQQGEAGWRSNFEYDVLGTVRLVAASLPHLEKSKNGNIVIISTTAALEKFIAAGPYNAMKAALLNYSGALSQDLAPKGIRVNAVSPGPIMVPGGSWDRIKTHMKPFYETTLAQIPLGRMGAPQEVAATVVMLVSPRCGFTTGTNVVVDGGITKRIQY